MTGRRIIGRSLLRSKLAKIGAGIIIAFILLMIFGPLVYPYSPADTGPINSAPSLVHPFGTDYQGHDILSQLIWGTFPSMAVGVLAALGAVILGLAVGVVAGYYDRVEGVLTGIADIIMTFPALALLLLIGSLFSVTDALIITVLILVLWPTVARSIRSQILVVKRMPYVEAAKMGGMSDGSIIARILVPSIATIAFGFFVLNVAASIILVTALQFIGMGDPNSISWGSMLYWAQQFAFYAGDWWWILAPGLSVSLVTLAFAFIGFSLEEVANPRLRT